MPKGHVRFVKRARRSAAPADPTRFTCDSVEGHDWFARLPIAAQDEFRAREEAVEERAAARGRLVVATRKRSIVQGSVVFVVNETVFASPSWAHSAAAIVVGAAVGALWHRMGAGRFRCMVTSVVPYAALRLAFVGESQIAATWFGLFGFLSMLCLTAAVGWEREQRRADDLDA